MPPQIRLFGWRATTGILPCAITIAKHVSGFSMGCSICIPIEEMDANAILECPLTSYVWQGCDFDCSLWASRFRILADCLDNTRNSFDVNQFGDFSVNHVGVLECQESLHLSKLESQPLLPREKDH